MIEVRDAVKRFDGFAALDGAASHSAAFPYFDCFAVGDGAASPSATFPRPLAFAGRLWLAVTLSSLGLSVRCLGF